MHPLIHVFSTDGKREEQMSRKLEMNLCRSIEVLLQICEFLYKELIICRFDDWNYSQPVQFL